MGQIANHYHFHTRWRKDCSARYGGMFDLPILKPIKAIRSIVREREINVLDFGAGRDKNGATVYQIPSHLYWTLDADPQSSADFTSLSDVPAGTEFGLVVMDQVIEHMNFESCYQIIGDLSKILAPGGLLSITVPNVSHPVRYWGDCDHITPWNFEDIYGLLKNSQLEVNKIGRFNKKNLGFNPINYILARQMRVIYRMDWCDSIWVLGEAPR